VGKTRLVEETLAGSGMLVLSSAATQSLRPPYEPIAAVLRSYLRGRPGDIIDCGSLSDHLRFILPELGPLPKSSDQTTLFEALRCAFSAITKERPTTVFLDDLHWADSTTLEFLIPLAGWAEHERLLFIGTYRSDEMPRGHPLRRMRIELRRARKLYEIVLEPLTQGETTALVTQVLGQPPAPQLAAAIYARTQGVPFFIEELAIGLAASDCLREGRNGIELASDQGIPLPDAVRDAVLLRAEGICEQAWQTLEVASVIGLQFDLDLVSELVGGDEGFSEPIERGLLVEVGPGRATFRHTLTREAVYREIPWSRRQALHHQIALRLQGRRAPPDELAGHWLAAREFERGRQALLASTEVWSQVHAYRDALRVASQALELWPEGEDEPGRHALLEQLGQCAELCGEFAKAAQSWQQVAEAHRGDGNLYQLGEAQRRLATVYELQGAWEQALAAHQAAAEAFQSHGLPGEAAMELLVAVNRLEAAGSIRAALELVTVATVEAVRAGRPDLQAQALGLEGQLRIELGQPAEAGLETIQAGLSLALDQNLTGAAAEVYCRLAWALDQTSDYVATREAYHTAITFCQANEISPMAQLCLACLSGVLLQIGEWDQASALCRDVLASTEAQPPIPAIAASILGCIQALRGQQRLTRSLLLEANAQGRQYGNATLEFYATWGLALVHELEGAFEAAADRYRLLRNRWENTEEGHYIIAPLR
jgi:tetratricopeptide (TPR) repeat protein